MQGYDNEKQSMVNPKTPYVKVEEHHNVIDENTNINYYTNPNYVVEKAFVPHEHKIQLLEGIFVKQKLDLGDEPRDGCNRVNRYEVYKKAQGKVKKAGRKLYKAVEVSDCCAQKFGANNCRPINIKIVNLGANEEYDKDCMLIERPCNCTFLCFNRPRIRVYHTEPDAQGNERKQLIGEISDAWDCLNYHFKLHNSNGDEVFKILTRFGQPGLTCRGCPCSSCESVRFDVYRSGEATSLVPSAKHRDREDEEDGNEGMGYPSNHGSRQVIAQEFDAKGRIAVISKKNKDCTKAEMSDSDNFGVDFPRNFKWQDKSLFLASVLFIDFMLFDENGSGSGTIGNDF